MQFDRQVPINILFTNVANLSFNSGEFLSETLITKICISTSAVVKFSHR
jgi:hypothetical protein